MSEKKLTIIVEKNDAQMEKRSESIVSKVADGLQRIGAMGVEAGAAMSKMGDATSAALARYRNSNQKAEAGAAKYRGMSSVELKRDLERINQELEEQKQILKQAQKKLAAYLENVRKDPKLDDGGSME